MAEDESFGEDSGMGGPERRDDDFGERYGGVEGGNNSQSVANMPYDEAMTLDDEDSMDSLASPNRPAAAGGGGGEPPPPAEPAPAPSPSPSPSPPPFQGGLDDSGGLDSPPAAGNQSQFSDDQEDGAGGADASAVYPSAAAQSEQMDMEQMQQQQQMAAMQQQAQPDASGAMNGAEGGDSSDSEDDAATGGAQMGAPSTYDPSRYADLRVGNDVKDLFQYIERYKPHQIELDTRLKPFIPEYIPAVGDIDAFLKVPRPDGKVEAAHMQLGLGILDEPAAQQSDPTVLDLQLRQSRKAGNMKEASVRSLEAADKNPKAIEQWITSINDLHRSKPQPTVTYSNDMPPVDPLMQAWPPKFEEMLREIQLPTAEIDMDLPQYVASLCAILDVPVYPGKLTQSLHVLFSLFAEFKANQHFAMYAQQPGMDGGGGGFGATGDGFGATGEIAGTETSMMGGANTDLGM